MIILILQLTIIQFEKKNGKNKNMKMVYEVDHYTPNTKSLK